MHFITKGNVKHINNDRIYIYIYIYIKILFISRIKNMNAEKKYLNI